jgi:hypothetical protein
MKRSLFSIAAMGLLLAWYVWQRTRAPGRRFGREAEVERWEDEGGAAGSRGSVR